MFDAQLNQVSLLAAFLAGVVSFVSPCVLPLVPSYVTFITGLSFDELTASDQGPRVRRLTLIHSLAFIAGFSIVFIALGATATAAGQFLREHQDTLRIAGGILIVFFGIYLTGIIQIPFLSRERKVHLSGKPLGVLGSILVGITFAAGWTPCIGPILASILLYASTAKTVGTGILLLSVYSLGLGLPFLLASLGMNSFLAASSRLRRSL
ncbi:MAG TPA: cytochrome c biogenesis CcdA family protein, partial [Candidatus Eisenbacteria bacterium]|nr:cytochrome c biogenesis CcdA family protein [Candidatus Eisenbacteria bacterium]